MSKTRQQNTPSFIFYIFNLFTLNLSHSLSPPLLTYESSPSSQEIPPAMAYLASDLL
jgi:hypothetical protein